MFWRWFSGKYGWGDAYDCIILDQKKEYLEEALELNPEDILVDSTFTFEDAKDAFGRLNTGRCRGKVIVEIKR